MGGELRTPDGAGRAGPQGETGGRVVVAATGGSTGRELAQKAAGLLAGGEVRMFLGYGSGRTPLRVRPRHVLRPEAAGGLVWNEFCAPSLVKYLLEEQEAEGRVGVLVKACDLRAVKRLMADRRVGMPQGQADRHRHRALVAAEQHRACLGERHHRFLRAGDCRMPQEHRLHVFQRQGRFARG